MGKLILILIGVLFLIRIYQYLINRKPQKKQQSERKKESNSIKTKKDIQDADFEEIE